MSSLHLKQARDARGLTAPDIVRITRLSAHVVSALDEGRVEDLPAGIYARTAIKEYARAVGLDPSAMLAELEPRLRPAHFDLAEMAALRASKAATRTARRALAGAIDAGVLLVLIGIIFLTCSAACRVSPAQLLRVAPAAVALLGSVEAAMYFWVLGATDVGTAGPWLLDVRILPPAGRPLTLNDLARRGAAYVICEFTFTR